MMLLRRPRNQASSEDSIENCLIKGSSVVLGLCILATINIGNNYPLSGIGKLATHFELVIFKLIWMNRFEVFPNPTF